MSQQGQIAPSSPAAAAPTPPPKPTQPPASSLWSRLAIPMFAVIVALGFVALATQRFDEWVGNAVVQTTNDAYVRAELTRLAKPRLRRSADGRGHRLPARQGRRSPDPDRSCRL
ncbi:hypothetical protein ACVWWR_003104 [Bradyrhizobium sp. LM3.2]